MTTRCNLKELCTFIKLTKTLHTAYAFPLSYLSLVSELFSKLSSIKPNLEGTWGTKIVEYTDWEHTFQ